MFINFTSNFLLFEFPCIISLYYTKNQQDATLAVLFISNYGGGERCTQGSGGET
jgi:hypothetical protein